MVVEIKTRGPEAFRRWRTLGAERSHPASVAQAAFYTLGIYGDLRDAVIATMDTGNRTWDWEFRCPPTGWSGPCRTPAHGWMNWPRTSSRTGPTPTRSRTGTSRPTPGSAGPVPFLAVCLPGSDTEVDEPETDEKEVSGEEAQDAVAAYAEAQEAMKEPEKAKRAALDTLKAWMRRQDDAKATVDGRTVSLVQSKRYSVNYRRLNQLLDPEVRAEVVTESESKYVRVTS